MSINSTSPQPRYPREVLAACLTLGKDPKELLAWSVRETEVVLILANGAKLRVRRKPTASSKPARRDA